MAPEIQINSCVLASLDQLKMSDILWSLAMVMFHLLNPYAKHPFALEIDNDNSVTALEQLKKLTSIQSLSVHLPKYHNLQVRCSFEAPK